MVAPSWGDRVVVTGGVYVSPVTLWFTNKGLE